MSYFLERLTYLTRRRETFADGLCELRDEDRMWEEGYRQRWQHLPDLLDALAERLLWRLVLGHADKIVRSTHGVNCSGGSSWRVDQISNGAQPAGQGMARGAQDHGTGRSVGLDRRQSASCEFEMRGRGGFVRANWDEVSEIIAAANVYTIKTFGPDRVVGFSPYLSLIGGTLLSFYDWYCDLPPSSPQTWGEQTDLPKSADWYNSG